MGGDLKLNVLRTASTLKGWLGAVGWPTKAERKPGKLWKKSPLLLEFEEGMGR